MAPPKTDTCKRGHPWTEENTYKLRGLRYCRACHKLRRRARYHKMSLIHTTPRGTDTHCAHGHEWTPGNLIIRRKGDSQFRACRQCRKENAKARYARSPESLAATERRIKEEERLNQRRKDIVEDWLKGKSYAEIGRAHQVSRQRIHQIIQKVGGVEIRILGVETEDGKC